MKEYNELLLNHYLKIGEQQSSPKIEILGSIKGSIKETLKELGIDYSTEILSESTTEQFGTTILSMTVAVYMPGSVKVGVSSVKLLNKKTDEKYPRETALDNAIANALGIDKLDIVSEDESPKTDDNSKTNTANSPTNTPDKPESKEEQRAKMGVRLNSIKAENNITDNNMLLRFVKSWNSSITTVEQMKSLTFEQWDSFMDFMESGN